MAITDYVNVLTTERNRAWEAQKEVLDLAANEKRELTGEERQTVERTDADLDRLDNEIKGWLDRDRREREGDQARDEWAKVVRPDVQEKLDQDDNEKLRAILRGGPNAAMDFNFQAVANEKRAIRAGLTGRDFRNDLSLTAAAGGNTVPTSFMRQLYDYLEVFSGMRRTGATIITTTGGENMEFPKVVTHGTAAIVGEGTAIAENDPTFGKLTLGAWKYGQLLQISRELLEDTGVDLTGFIAKDMGRALARVTDAAYVNGGGTNAPLGVMVPIGTGVGPTLGTNAGVVTMDNLIDLVYSVNEEYRNNGAHWLMKDAAAGSIRKLKDTDGQYLWQPSTQAGQPDRLLNYPVVTDPNVAAVGTSSKSIAFGDFSAFIIRDVGTVRVEASTDYAFANDLTTYKATVRTDSDLIDLTGAIKAYVGGTA
jgi:HK97 family phage major capsid protein